MVIVKCRDARNLVFGELVYFFGILSVSQLSIFERKDITGMFNI